MQGGLEEKEGRNPSGGSWGRKRFNLEEGRSQGAKEEALEESLHNISQEKSIG